MAVIRLPQQYANDRFAEQVREASQSIGELAIAIKMYRPWVEDLSSNPEHFPHCPRCWDEFYQEPTDKNCPVCGGSGYSTSDTDRGIKEFGRLWIILSDNTFTQAIIRQYGQFSPDERMIQYEGGVELAEHDYILRVKQWSHDYRPLAFGDRFRLQNPYPTVSLRSGNEPAQYPGRNVVGYRAKAVILRDYQETFDFPPDQPIPRFPLPEVT